MRAETVIRQLGELGEEATVELTIERGGGLFRLELWLPASHLAPNNASDAAATLVYEGGSLAEVVCAAHEDQRHRATVWKLAKGLS